METNEDIKTTEESHVGHQFGKLMLGTAVGFIATKLAEAAYHKVVESRNRPTTDQS